ncbi:NADH dehydrogenase flavoprotein 2, mitochondrial [Eumeta japonica]|uniref:NADH dehydrogenase flavoprotein 2, mitochondrial n=1 Tax=Eumeta variegata TaxID=151549 RepID=A0A4C1WU54_EUMVA|nr:NADH dehydrogenase flavoprotein 2, mitochondrial [Eumeta japonica]
MIVKFRIANRSLWSNILRALHITSRLPSDVLFVHRDTPENNADTPFFFCQENMDRACALINLYPEGHSRGALIALLDLAQRQCGWLPLSAMHYVADMLRLPRMRVYEVATFYTMFIRQPAGQNIVNVCMTTPCWLRGSECIMEAVKDATKAEVGGISPCGRFSVFEVECLGACVNAPMIQINDDFYEDLTVEDVCRIIADIKECKKPNAGPQSGRFASEPICGLTSLCTPPLPPGHSIQDCLR